MNTISNSYQAPATASIDEGINALLDQAKARVTCGYQACEDRIQSEPVGSVIGAVAAGYCLHRLPMRAIVLANVRLVAALAPPALFFYGAAKVYEFLKRQEPAGEAVGFHPIENDT